jgi:predicted alpha/beta-hydrolase family hydrolase
VLTHGAGGNCQSALLVAVANAFEKTGFVVLRYDLPFRQKRRFGPPFPAQAAEDRVGLRTAVSEMHNTVTGRVFLGGHSYGGRQASILASENASIADGLLLLPYPLHPPKKPEQMRTAHFTELRTPGFFVHGTKDPFGSIKEMQNALSLIPATTKLSVVEGAGHELARGKFDVAELVVMPFQHLLEGISF